MISQAETLAQTVGVKGACEALNVPRSSLYRARQVPKMAKPRPKPARALSEPEKETVRELLNSERFYDQSPRQVYAILLDEDQRYLCHWRTMYRILAEYDEVRERRAQSQHPPASKPHLVTSGPNQLWSWDGRPFGRLVNIAEAMIHHQGWVSSPWRSREPSSPRLVSFQGKYASCAGETDPQNANVSERMGWG